uniref:Odorant receptor n=1 Tax=Bracon brevicornis TaxID=1563983 RepID=A0A6V7JW81_9HYME
MFHQQAIDLLYRCGKTEEIIESIVGFLSYPVAIVKIIFPRLYWKNMKVILESAIDDWSRDIDNNDRKTMMKWVAIGRFFFILEISSLCVFLSYATVSHFPLAIFLQDTLDNVTVVLDRTLPWGSGCWLPPTISNPLFILAYVTTCIQQIIGSLSNMGFDVSVFIIMSHMCGQLEILDVDLDITETDPMDLGQITKEPKQAYRTFIDRHNHLLKLCELFEETFSSVILIHMIMYIGLVTILRKYSM